MAEAAILKSMLCKLETAFLGVLQPWSGTRTVQSWCWQEGNGLHKVHPGWPLVALHGYNSCAARLPFWA